MENKHSRTLSSNEQHRVNVNTNNNNNIQMEFNYFIIKWCLNFRPSEFGQKNKKTFCVYVIYQVEMPWFAYNEVYCENKLIC